MNPNVPAIFIGIDPGKNGGVASIHDGYTKTETLEYEPANLVDQLRQIEDHAKLESQTVYCAIEQPPRYIGRPLPGSVIGPLFGSYGTALGAALAFRWIVHTVRPQGWQRGLGLSTSKKIGPTNWKKHLKSEAIKRFPQIKVTYANADALLIAYWCRFFAAAPVGVAAEDD